MVLLVPIACGVIVGVGISFMTNLHWSIVGVTLVLIGMSLLLVRLAYVNSKNKKRGG